jgi:hypothetical protein
MQSRSRYAFVLSFAVYLFPLIGPHVVFLLGQALWLDVTRRERELSWIITDAGFAVVLQFLAFALLYWFFGKPVLLRGVVVVLALSFLALGVNYAYLIYIPSRFLIEAETAGETGNWAVECAAQEVGLVGIAHPSGVMDWPEFLVQSPDGAYKLMHVPGCELIPLSVPQAKIGPGGRADFVIGLSYFVPGRGVVFNRHETATGAFTWNFLSNGQLTVIPGLHPAAAPILSLDGEWAGWIERESVAIERLDGSEAPLQIPLENIQTWSYILRTIDMQQGEIELANSDRRVVVGLDGKIKSSAVPPLVWDSYRDNGPYRVSWNANGHSGTHNALKGRSINSAAMTPSGDLVAVSVATALNIGSIRDAIYVLRATDGTEAFRRYLPMYTRTPVFFATDDLLVYTADRQVVVVRVAR